MKGYAMSQEPLRHPTDEALSVEELAVQEARRKAAHEAYKQHAEQEAAEEAPVEEPEAQVEESAPAEEIADPQAEVMEKLERAMRALAEADNIRKRLEREKEDAAKYAVTGFAKDMVEVAENLMRAVGTIPDVDRLAGGALANVAEGVEMTMQILLKSMEKQGIRRIEPLGEKFDHHYHQAIAQAESAEHAPGTVMQVVQAGYVIHDRLLRPALVVVAQGSTTSTQA